MTKPVTKTCFVVGPIGDADSEIRQRADALLTYIIKEVLEASPFGMHVERADEMAKPGLITNQVIERVVNADLVVADLAGPNANVLYELALRHVSRRPVVHMLPIGQALPFDVAPQRSIIYDTKDIATAGLAKKELRKHAEAVMANPETADNPISAALLSLDLMKSHGTTEQLLGRILKEVAEVRESVFSAQLASAPRVPDATKFWSAKSVFDAYNAPTPTFSEIAEQRKLWDKLMKPPHLETLRSILANDEAFAKAVGQALTNAPKALPRCAICGQPIVGSVGQRSSDNAPIHWEGKCPPPAPSGGVPSTTG